MVQALEGRPRRFAGLARQIHHRHAQAVAGISANRSVDLPLGHVGPGTVGDGQVLSTDLPAGDHPDQGIHGLTGPRHDHQAAGVLVEPVDDACPGQVQNGGVQGQQAIEQGALPMPGRRMHHQTGWLVEHAQMLIHINRLEGHRLRHKRAGLLAGPQRDAHLLPLAHFGRWLADHPAVEQDIARFDALLKITAGESVDPQRQGAVKTLSVMGRLQTKLPEFGLINGLQAFIRRVIGAFGFGCDRYNQLE